MFKRSMRLTRADFEKISLNRREHGRFFSMNATPSKGAAKFACVVSKKTAPKAHDRNLIRRHARAAFREIGSKAAIIYIFTAKKGIHHASYAEIRSDLAALVAKAEKILNDAK